MRYSGNLCLLKNFGFGCETDREARPWFVAVVCGRDWWPWLCRMQTVRLGEMSPDAASQTIHIATHKDESRTWIYEEQETRPREITWQAGRRVRNELASQPASQPASQRVVQPARRSAKWSNNKNENSVNKQTEKTKTGEAKSRTKKLKVVYCFNLLCCFCLCHGDYLCCLCICLCLSILSLQIMSCQSLLLRRFTLVLFCLPTSYRIPHIFYSRYTYSLTHSQVNE